MTVPHLFNIPSPNYWAVDKMHLRRIFVYFTVYFVVNVGGVFLGPPSDSGIQGVRKAMRLNIPWLWLGMQCNGCPPSSCEDDEAIIHGYCCGCAYTADRLPVLCPQFLQCPLNLHGLCHDYEYMMRCCC